VSRPASRLYAGTATFIRATPLHDAEQGKRLSHGCVVREQSLRFACRSLR
jgi:hypothetical protein